MDERENFIRARDNESDIKYLGTPWQVFRDYRVGEKTDTNVHIHAPRYDPGLPQFRKQPDGTLRRRYTGEWAVKDDNAGRGYAPLREEPDLFLRFAALAGEDPYTRGGRLETTMDWLKNYGVLGIVLEGDSVHDLRSTRRENLLLFWEEVHRAAKCLASYKAATGPARALKRSGLPGKTLAGKRMEASRYLEIQVRSRLERECYPKLYYGVRKDTGETANVGLSWGFRSLLGAMYLQLAWRIKSRRCEAPGCSNIIGLHERADKIVCSKACAQRRRDHRDKAAAW